MPLNPKWVCGCIPPVPLIDPKYPDEDTGLCEVCQYVYDERLYTMRLRQHWSDPENPIPEGVDDLHDMLKAISPEYRAAVNA